jgi:3D (Asp-Asp-Asp) domain-containing protein
MSFSKPDGEVIVLNSGDWYTIKPQKNATSNWALKLPAVLGVVVVFLFLSVAVASFGFGEATKEPGTTEIANRTAPKSDSQDSLVDDDLKRAEAALPSTQALSAGQIDKDQVDRPVDQHSAPECWLVTAADHRVVRVDLSEKEPANRGIDRALRMLATAYTLECGNGDGYTATMTRPRIGVIAVDPRVIPYGFLVYIEGYGYFRAEDTGGAIKGHRVDIFMVSRSEALNFGRRWVDVKLIGKIEE